MYMANIYVGTKNKTERVYTHIITDSITVCKCSLVLLERGCQVLLLLTLIFTRFRFICPVNGYRRDFDQSRSYMLLCKT